MSARGFFLDKVAGTPSMVRLIALILTLDASAVTAVIAWVALHGGAASLIAALTGALGALVASGVVALFKRAKATDCTPEGENKPEGRVGFTPAKDVG